MANEKKASKRVWQSPKGPNAKTELITLNDVDPKTGRFNANGWQAIRPNAAGQYVLPSNAWKHDDQEEAMEHYAKKYHLKEIDPKSEGILPVKWEGMETPENMEQEVSTLRDELEKAKKANEELVAKMAELEAKAKK